MSDSRSSVNDNNSGESSKGVFLIPLQSTTSPEIKSYITAYKHSDSIYTYRVYNKDSLSQITPTSLHAKKNLLNTQAVLGYFEKTINNKDSIQVVSPGNGTIKNVNISFGNINQHGGGRSSGNVASSTTSMTCESTIYTTILYEWHDYSYSYEGDGAWVAIAVYSETVISCYDSDSGDYDPYGGGTGGSGNYYDPYGGGTNNWWDYGTGYPYGGGSADPNSPYYDPYNDPNNPYYDPNNYTDWYPWWTGGGGSGTDPYYDPVYINDEWYSPTEYPGNTLGFPWKWWENDIWLSDPNNFNLDLDPEQNFQYRQLTAAEKALVKVYPKEAAIMYSNKSVAENQTEIKMGINGLNDKSDAFRHCFFQAINTKSIGSYLTQLFSIAHESEVPPQLLLEKRYGYI